MLLNAAAFLAQFATSDKLLLWGAKVRESLAACAACKHGQDAEHMTTAAG